MTGRQMVTAVDREQVLPQEDELCELEQQLRRRLNSENDFAERQLLFKELWRIEKQRNAKSSEG